MSFLSIPIDSNCSNFWYIFCILYQSNPFCLSFHFQIHIMEWCNDPHLMRLISISTVFLIFSHPMHQWTHWTLQFVFLGISMFCEEFQIAWRTLLMCCRFYKSYVIWITSEKFIYASFVNALASYNRINNLYRCFKVVKSTSRCFFHLIFCERSVPFAFLTNSTKDYQTVFLDLKIPQWEFGKTLSYDYQKTGRNTLIALVHKETNKFPLLTLIFKFVQL